ncbi:MAG: response regulator [Bacteroidia bacterium]
MHQLINILLVEDDDIDVMNVKRAFKKNNITNPLFRASNGVEALEMLRAEGEAAINPLPRIILLDLNMPKMGGIEFLKALRADERLRGISVFIMTTSNEDKDKVEAYQLNVAGYILKPLSVDQFVSAVATLNNYWQLIEFPKTT